MRRLILAGLACLVLLGLVLVACRDPATDQRECPWPMVHAVRVWLGLEPHFPLESVHD